MLTRVSIENFKGFSGRQELRLAPITLIYGQNSAGKSSVIQSLLLLKQTFERTLQKDFLSMNRSYADDFYKKQKYLSHHEKTATKPTPPENEFIFEGDAASLGSFNLCVNDHDNGKSIGLGLHFSNRECAILEYLNKNEFGVELKVGDLYGGKGLSDSGDFKEKNVGIIEVSYSMDSELDTKIRFMRCTPAKNDAIDLAGAKIFNAESCDVFSMMNVAVNGIGKNDICAFSEKEFNKLFKGKSCVKFGVDGGGWLPNIINETKNIKYDNADVDVTDAAITMANELIEGISRSFVVNVSNISHLGPLRKPPIRLERFTKEQFENKKVSTVGSAGENTTGILYDKSVASNLNEWFEKIGIPYTVDLEHDKKSGPVHITDYLRIVLTDKRTNVKVLATDVGFGISQLMPIIVEGLINKETICVEQPETHLHPKMQAELADFFISTSIKSGSDGCQWIIETHSEALMLRIMRRVRDGKINHNDISVIYVEPTPDGAIALQLSLDRRGDFIDEWPGGFFEQSFDDIVGGA